MRSLPLKKREVTSHAARWAFFMPTLQALPEQKGSITALWGVVMRYFLYWEQLLTTCHRDLDLTQIVSFNVMLKAASYE